MKDKEREKAVANRHLMLNLIGRKPWTGGISFDRQFVVDVAAI